MKKTFNTQQYHWQPDIDYRKHPEKYRVGKGEQGVLICEPYKSEICPYWKFKTPAIATESSNKIYQLFIDYLAKQDFVGADMARKYLQMGFTRARRYTNYKGGKKYATDTGKQLIKGTGNPEKAISAKIFYDKWQDAESNPLYHQLKIEWKKKLG